MLRASAQKSGIEVDLRPIATGVGDTGIPHGREIMAFTDAVVLRDSDELPHARADLETVAGTEFADRAAMVAGNFSMMNRSLDAIGAPVGKHGLPTAALLGVEIPEHLM